MSPEEQRDAKRFDNFIKTEEFQNRALVVQTQNTTNLLKRFDTFIQKMDNARVNPAGFLIDVIRASISAGMGAKIVEKKLNLKPIKSPFEKKLEEEESVLDKLKDQWEHVKKPSAPRNRKLKKKIEEQEQKVMETKQSLQAIDKTASAAGAVPPGGGGGAGALAGGAEAGASAGAVAGAAALAVAAVIAMALKKVFDESMAPAIEVARSLKNAGFPRLVNGLNIALEPWMEIMDIIGEMMTPVFNQMVQKALPTLVEQLPKIQEKITKMVESGQFDNIGTDIATIVTYLPEMVSIWMQFIALDWDIVISIIKDSMPTIISFLTTVNNVLQSIRDGVDGLRNWFESANEFEVQQPKHKRSNFWVFW